MIDDQLIAMESCLYQAAMRREDLLRNFYEIGRRAVARTSPYAFVIPVEQRDPSASTQMLVTLNYGQVEIEKASEPFEAGLKQYKKGSYVIRMQQPYSSWAKTLLERQNYPDLRLYPGGPPKRPYDVTAQTLPMLMGVQVDTVDAPFTAKLERTTVFPFLPDRKPESGAIPASDTEAWHVVTSIWGSSPGVFRDPATGDFYAQPPQGKQLQFLPRPRIGLYKSNVPNIDEGWTRWLLDKLGFEYLRLDHGEISDAPTMRRVKIVIFPDQPPSQIAEGFRPGTMPPANMGGLGRGEPLVGFVKNGGTAVFLNHSTDYAIDIFGLKVKNVLSGLSNREFYSPGSILNCTLDTKNQLSRGLPEAIHIWSEGSPAWDVPEGAGTVVARYPEKDILASGWLLGEKYLAGKAALVDVPVGKGHVILFGMRPQYRAQSYQTFKLLFNSFLIGD